MTETPLLCPTYVPPSTALVLGVIRFLLSPEDWREDKICLGQESLSWEGLRERTGKEGRWCSVDSGVDKIWSCSAGATHTLP